MARKTIPLVDIVGDYELFYELYTSGDEDYQNLHDQTKYAYQLAMAHLLKTADRDEYRKALIRSAEQRKLLLQKAQSKPDEYTDCSWGFYLAPFWGAVITGETALAKEIAALSTFPQNEGFEYRDEFLYSRLIYRLCLDDWQITPVSQAILDEYLEDWSGEETARYRAVTALAAGENIPFEKALREILNDHADFYEEMGSGLIDDLATYTTERRICLEACALVTLAKAKGMKVQKNYRGIPFGSVLN